MRLVDPIRALALALLLACGGRSEPAAPGKAAARPAPAPATTLPSAESVLDGFVAATGGRAAYEKLQTRVSSGTFSLTALNQRGTFTMYQAAPRKMVLLIEMPGIGKEERGTDGETAWSKSAMTGNRIVDGEERAQMLRTAALQSEIQWRELYSKVETVGVEEVDGHRTYKLDFHTPEGTVEHRNYDVESKLLVRTTLVEKSAMGEVPVESISSDYRKAGDLLLAHKAVIKAMSMEQILTLEKIEHNVAIDPKRFEVPADVRAGSK